MTDAKQTLWLNLSALLIQRYGTVNLNRFHIDCKLSTGTISSIKKQQAATGLDVISKIAAFFGIEPWQLLMPNLDPTNPPVFSISKAERELYERIKSIKLLAAEISKEG